MKFLKSSSGTHLKLIASFLGFSLKGLSGSLKGLESCFLNVNCVSYVETQLKAFTISYLEAWNWFHQQKYHYSFLKRNLRAGPEFSEESYQVTVLENNLLN